MSIKNDKLAIFFQSAKNNILTAWQEFNKHSVNRRFSLSSQLIWKYWHQNLNGLREAILFIESQCRVCQCIYCKDFINGSEEAAVPCFIVDFFRQNASHMSRKTRMEEEEEQENEKRDFEKRRRLSGEDDVCLDARKRVTHRRERYSPIPRHRRFPSCLRSLKLLLLLICVKYKSGLKRSSMERVLAVAHRLHRVEIQYLEHERRLLFCGMDLITDLTDFHRELEADFIGRKCLWWNCYKKNTTKLFDTLREQESQQLSHLLNSQLRGRKSIEKYCYEDIPPTTLYVPLRAHNRKVMHY